MLGLKNEIKNSIYRNLLKSRHVRQTQTTCALDSGPFVRWQHENEDAELSLSVLSGELQRELLFAPRYFLDAGPKALTA